MPTLHALAMLLFAALAIPGCTAAQHVPTNQAHADTPWAPDPDADAITRVLASPAAEQLAGSFLRAQFSPQSSSGTAPLRQVERAVTVYATAPGFVTDPRTTLRDAGAPAYIAVPVRVGSRAETDTLQLDPAPPYTPRAVAEGNEEAQTARLLADDTRLLLHYPSHTWFGWTETRVVAIRSDTDPGVQGRIFDAAQFRAWLTSR
ncbi:MULTISPECIES: hypothetical protein [unclassified Nocardia]|uniref:hypothetical protein n=1 Tax=unclassified Nocardia TaxID=2637762 RepID=UPI001CE3F5F1|nr:MULTISPECIES: hypothetical protein [unclassified Nocardia]